MIIAFIAKIVKKCTLPLTVAHKVNTIITEKGVFEIKNDGLHLVEISPYSSLEDIRQTTEADFTVDTVTAFRKI